MRNRSKRLFIFVLVIFSVYLFSPTPDFPPLPDSLLSAEPGDTVEIPGVWAYYTNLSRAEILDFYQQAFSRSAFFGLPLPVVTLNHPPEYGREAIRETTETTFLYELVHPLRDSMYLNGWDPAEDPDFKAADPTQVIEIEGTFYERKVILRYRDTAWWARLMMMGLTFFSLWVLGWHVVRAVSGWFQLRRVR